MNVEGSIDFWQVYDVDTGISYDYRPVVLALTDNVRGMVLMENTSTVTQFLRAVIWITDPNGDYLALRNTGWISFGPNTDFTPGSEPFQLYMPGDWSLHANLYVLDDWHAPIDSPAYEGRLIDFGQWHIITVNGNGNGNGGPDKYKCPYCDAWFDTEEEWETHILDEHGEEPPGEGSDLLKYALIGGGIIAVSAFVIRPLIRRK